MPRLKFHHAHYPVDGWLPHFWSRYSLRPGVTWMIEWRRFWMWWETHE